MQIAPMILVTSMAAALASGTTSTLDLHLTTGSNGVEAQMTANVRTGLHVNATWDASGVTAHAQVLIGPATVTLDKSDGQPLRIDVAGLGMAPAPPLGSRPADHGLIAATDAFVAPPSAGFLDTLGSATTAVLGEIARWVQTVIPFLILGLLLMLLVPSLESGVRGTAMRAPWERLGIGVVVLIAMPSASIALLVAGIFLGVWWLGIMMVGLYAIALAAGYTFSGMVVGQALFDRIGATNVHLFWALLGGLAVISVLTLIPYAGLLVALAAVTYGMGALALAPRTPAAEAPPARLPRAFHLPALAFRRPAADREPPAATPPQLH